MRRRTPNQKAEADSKCFSPRRITAKTITIAAICLSFAQTAIAATGTVNYNTVYQQIEGFGAAGVYDAPSLTSNSQRETLYDLMFRDLGLDILRIRNTYSTDSGGYGGDNGSNLTATKTMVAAAKLRNPALKTELVPWSPPASCSSGA
jgi:O-glycosyl hydrolase